MKFTYSTTQAHEAKYWYTKKLQQNFNNTKNEKIGKLGKFSWIYFLEDPIYNSYLFSKMITHFTKQGKKLRAQKIFYRLFGLGGNTNKLQLDYFFQVIEKLRPGLASVPVRFGRNIEHVPMPIMATKSYRKAMRYFVTGVYDRKYDKTLEEKIYNEFYDMFFTSGYLNSYLEKDFKASLNNSHLKHFRRFGIF